MNKYVILLVEYGIYLMIKVIQVQCILQMLELYGLLILLKILMFQCHIYNLYINIYLQKTLNIRDSKFGPALVVDTLPQSGNYTLGFRIDPPEKLHEVYQEISSLFQIFSVNPIFGIEYTIEEKQQPPDAVKTEQKVDDIEIVNTTEGDNLAAYYALGGKETNRTAKYNPELGLAVEELPAEISLSSLWNVF